MLVNIEVNLKAIENSVINSRKYIEENKDKDSLMDSFVEYVESLSKVKSTSDFVEVVDTGIYKGYLDKHALKEYFDIDGNKIEEYYSFSPRNMDEVNNFDNIRENYGTADNIEQVLKHYPELIDEERKFIVVYNDLIRAEMPPFYGFRYGKNGSYIGNQNPQSEYFYDDKHIDKIIIYHIYEILK